jgi:ubiquinone/menaquinone biosynthesis C-methylase UbiE
MVSEYTLALSEAEIGRYQMMARHAVTQEGSQLAVAGVVAGATVADVGCGPAAMSIELARLVGPSGQVIAVERDKQALAAAAILIQRSRAGNVSLQEGEATATGLEPGSVDVAMLRLVLAHNGGHEQAIVDHLATLIRPGGSVYLVDGDQTGGRILDLDPDLDDLMTRYVEFHRRRGNDPAIGLRLAQLLAAAGLEVTSFQGVYNILTAPPGMRPPAWAARDAMLADGIVDEDVLHRWEAAFTRHDSAPGRPTIFAPQFTAIGRRPA